MRSAFISTPVRTGSPRRTRTVLAVILLALALAALTGCRTDAQDQNFDFNNTNDPNQDTGNGTGTGTGAGQVAIASVNTDPDVVVLVNQGTEITTMDKWTLENDDATPAKFTFSGFKLLAGRFVRVHSTVGTDTSVDLYSDAAPNWGPNSPNNVARLKNDAGVTIDSCDSSKTTTCWN